MKKNVKFPLLTVSVFLLLVALLISCEHQPVTTGNPGDNSNDTSTNLIPCDPDTVYFVNKVLPLIVQSCAQSGCHNAASGAGGVVLNSYSTIITNGRVEPGRPDNSDLYKEIQRDQMPPGNPLPTDQRNIIYNWILQGAKNNSCNDCDTTSFLYSSSISRIINDYCVACHSGPNVNYTGGGILLDNYNNVKTQGQNGKLLNAVKHTGLYPMPKGGNKLNDCKIKQIEKWIDNNYPN